MSLAAGRLRHRITIESKQEIRDADGDSTISWATFATVWAEIAPLSAKELLAAQAVQSEVSVRIVIRALPGVTAAMRVRRDDGRVYDIAGVIEDNDSGKEWMTLPCSLGVSDG